MSKRKVLSQATSGPVIGTAWLRIAGIVLITFILAWQLLFFLVGMVGDPHENLAALIGLAFGQTAIGALWVVWGKGSGGQRRAIAIASAITAYLTILFSAEFVFPGLDNELFVVLGVGLVLFALFLTISVTYIKRIYGLHLNHQSSLSQATDGPKSQFGVRDLLLLTLIIGLMLASVSRRKGMIPEQIFGSMDRMTELSIFFFMLVGYFLVLLCPVVFVLLSRTIQIKAFVLVLAFSLFEMWTEPLMFGLFLGLRQSTNYYFFVGLNLPFFFICIVVLMIVRLHGFVLSHAILDDPDKNHNESQRYFFSTRKRSEIA